MAPFLEYLPECNNPSESPLISLFDEELVSVGEDKVRQARILLNKAKMQRILAHHTSLDCCQDLLKQYLEYSKLDGKPEKGERKIADDFILVLDEILAETSQKEPRDDSGALSKVDLFRVGLLEYALQLSPYNFDI